MSHPIDFDFTKRLPKEMSEWIFEYLSVKDLLNACLVSKQWNCLIGNSKIFKDQVLINISDLVKNRPIFALSQSQRSYEIINIRKYKKPSDLKNIRGKEWKKVFFNIARLKSQKDFIEIINKNFPVVRNLTIMNVSIKELSKEKLLSLQHLESLTFSDISLDVFDIFLIDHPNMKNLSLKFIYGDIAHPSGSVGNQVIKFLQMNKQIKHLELYVDVVNDLFQNDITQSVNLNLSSLAINISRNTSTNVRSNVESFLKSQGSTLENLRILFHDIEDDSVIHFYKRVFFDFEDEMASEENSQMYLALFNSWNSLTALEKLTLRFFKSSNDFAIDRDMLKTLQRNSNVLELKIQNINCEVPRDAITTIINLVPNIRAIYITKLTPQILSLLATKFISLRSIKYLEEEGDCKTVYKEMINEKKCDNKFIEISQAYLG